MRKLRHRVVQGIVLDYKVIQGHSGDQKPVFLGQTLLATDTPRTQILIVFSVGLGIQQVTSALL